MSKEIDTRDTEIISEVINEDQLSITPHALEQFATRFGVGIVEAAAQLRNRWAKSQVIRAHDAIHIRPENGTLFSQDAQAEDTVYVTKPNKKRGSYRLSTVLRSFGRPHNSPEDDEYE